MNWPSLVLYQNEKKTSKPIRLGETRISCNFSSGWLVGIFSFRYWTGVVKKSPCSCNRHLSSTCIWPPTTSLSSSSGSWLSIIVTLSFLHWTVARSACGLLGDHGQDHQFHDGHGGEHLARRGTWPLWSGWRRNRHSDVAVGQGYHHPQCCRNFHPFLLWLSSMWIGFFYHIEVFCLLEE